MMMLRTARLKTRGEGIFAFTAANRAAREKKLAASSPKNMINIATNRRGKKRKNLATCSCRPRIPSTLTPSRMKPSQATQKANRLNISVAEGSAALLSSWEAPAFSESLSNLTSRRMLRRTTFTTYAITQPTSARISITMTRGRKWAKLLAISCSA